MTEIWAAPFYGEFGWETTIWSPWLRHEQHRLQVPFHVVCERGKGLLYEDFATVHEVPEAIGLRRDCQNAFRPQGGKLTREDYENFCMMAAGHGVKCLTPIDLVTAWPGGTPKARQAAFKSYALDAAQREPGRTMVIHARRAQHEERNWSEARWNELIDQNQDARWVSIGSRDGALHVPGSEDHRGISLDSLSLTMNEAEAVVGPSSGPLAFAMLCETPVVWWSENRKDVARFIGSWNPFKVDTHRVKESWQPTAGEVARVCRRFW